MILPEEFQKQIKALLPEEYDAFFQAIQDDKSPTSIRINRSKCKVMPEAAPVAWCSDGFYLAERPSFTFDPVFHAGRYYVQEASSMFLGQVFEQYVGQDSVKVLDLCAAPGGKSTHIASLISKDSILVSNEVIKSRASVLAENITKSGYPNVIVTNNDPADFGTHLKNMFDIILVDAPCSGEGMFRKDHQAITEWSLNNVQLCKERQQRILSDVWDALTPGGMLIYSTCTYNTSENEENVKWMQNTFDAEALPLETKKEWNIQEAFTNYNIPVYHFLPNKTKGEGFFLAVLRKPNNNETFLNKHQKDKRQKKGKEQKIDDKLKNYLCEPDEYTFFEKSSLLFAFPSVEYSFFELIVSKLRLVSAGICIGETKGKDFIPHQSLALSQALNKNVFNSLEVDKATAISYLRKETLILENAPKGYLLLTYEDAALGFVKNIGNRANNLYPTEWRIRKAYI